MGKGRNVGKKVGPVASLSRGSDLGLFGGKKGVREGGGGNGRKKGQSDWSRRSLEKNKWSACTWEHQREKEKKKGEKGEKKKRKKKWQEIKTS